jgi:hypothetical protein
MGADLKGKVSFALWLTIAAGSVIGWFAANRNFIRSADNPLPVAIRYAIAITSLFATGLALQILYRILTSFQ